ncbi:MAG: Bacterial regulatory protein, arsR family [Candidatus Methanofastidiosum methylothiophilum]|uniref:Bacterial regulatory protein, arsR family n=1 Tax=Candidatus Methanofastidiosum methylothiophilum TaxID=1705564 RepID=A0A150IKW7_9EURY|nr:MAG: Bacterial regulatory protein, arsR family [Candidatus Methanofastidiosum methylthiophilus]KYC47712.1 MAG: Bacterial regulatory protein, arsR family [Candidatus Methanofastidiosum methylthiophilus]KYC50282.1 MAG: Bacterial regulatory protein, arsR family [Candidatus Methanofastidiosum methylthiophilus]
MDKDKKILLWLIAGSRGGLNRALILKYIISNPSNANRISLATGIEYKTVQHHLNILEKNGLLIAVGDKYGKTYFPSDLLDRNINSFNEICNNMGLDNNEFKTE